MGAAHSAARSRPWWSLSTSFWHASTGAVELDQHQPELVQRGRGLHTGPVTECPAQLAEVVLGDHELVANVVVVAAGVVRMLGVGHVVRPPVAVSP